MSRYAPEKYPGEVERQLFGDVKAAVVLHLHPHIRPVDPEAPLDLAPVDEPDRVEDPAEDREEDEAPDDAAGDLHAPPPTLTCGAVSASTGASKNSRRSKPNRLATITGGNTWIFVLYVSTVSL